jgi:hypothetical protein
MFIHKTLANKLNDDRNHRMFLRSIGNLIHLESFFSANIATVDLIGRAV